MTDTCFTDTRGGTGLTNGTSYCYFVRARNAAGASPPSSTGCATPFRIKQITWGEYYKKIKDEFDPRPERLPHRCHPFEERLQVIRVARILFATYPHFEDIPPDGQRMIAGTMLVKVNGLDFGWFGDMRQTRRAPAEWSFWNRINDNDPNLSLALDCIPTTGGISKEKHFDPYIKALPKGCGIATGTRLLAMKRPYTFVCVCRGNDKRLCDAFGVSSLDGSDWAEKYWDKIILKIRESTWWKVPRPSDSVEQEVWEARAAFLDSLFYDYSGDEAPDDDIESESGRARAAFLDSLL